jgi:hypothetical protein
VCCGHDARQVIDIIITKSVVEYRAEILKNADGQPISSLMMVTNNTAVYWSACERWQH